jgi:hypothetical protein
MGELGDTVREAQPGVVLELDATAALGGAG